MLGELTDLIASIGGKWGRWLNVRQNRWSFIVWTVCLMYWTVRNYEMGLIVQTGSTFISVILNMYGFYTWKSKDKKNV